MTPAAIQQRMTEYAQQHDGWFGMTKVFGRASHDNNKIFQRITDMVVRGELQEVLEVEYRSSRGLRFRRKHAG